MKEREAGYYEMLYQNTLEFLQTNNIPIEPWGRAGAKTLDDLVREIESGDCILECPKVGEVVRVLRTARIKVLCKIDKNNYELVEGTQTLPDGSTRDRLEQFGSGIAEKLHLNEDALAGAVRGIREELFNNNLEIPILSKNITSLGVEKTVRESQSYPGIYNHSNVFIYLWKMPINLYKAEGYKEIKENGQVTPFVWRKKI